MIASLALSSKVVWLSRYSLRWLHKLNFNGSLLVIKAKDPDKFYTIKWVPFSTFFSSGSIAKSLRDNSLVVINAIVTDPFKKRKF